MKKSGTKPESILTSQPKRGWLDRIKVPRKFRVKNRFCDWKLSFMFFLIFVAIIDFAVLIKQTIQLVEMKYYAESYPSLIAFDNIIKFCIIFLLLIVEKFLILRKPPSGFKFCKVAYALKIIQIGFVFFQSCFNTQLLQEQCQEWLSNPAHGFKRDSSDI